MNNQEIQAPKHCRAVVKTTYCEMEKEEGHSKVEALFGLFNNDCQQDRPIFIPSILDHIDFNPKATAGCERSQYLSKHEDHDEERDSISAWIS